MIFDWISNAIAALWAFFSSDTFFFALFWLFAPYVVAWIVLLRCHRPWEAEELGMAPDLRGGGSRGSAGGPVAGLSVVDLDGLAGLAGAFAGVAGDLCRAGVRGPRRLCVLATAHQGRRHPPHGRPLDDGKQEFESMAPPLGPRPATVGTGRRIVIFCDGTSNKPDQLSEGIAAPTNVYKLFTHLAKSEAQTGWYDAGVGTETSSKSLAGKTLSALAKMVGWVKATQFFGAFVKFRTISRRVSASASPKTSCRPIPRSSAAIVPAIASTSWAFRAAPTRRVAWPA